jgi:hypothetical protein
MARKSRSGRRSRESPASQEPTAKAPSAPTPGRGAALSRELADFLVEFSIVLNKRSMYPSGHPQLRTAAERFVQRLTVLLEGRDSVTLGVARHRLVIESVTTDPNNALLRELAHRLHRHKVASVHLTRGINLDEIEALLVALSADPQRDGGPVGARLNQIGPWQHIRLRAIGYDKFALQESDQFVPADAELDETRDYWVELARLALSTEHNPDSLQDADPLVVAQAIDRKSGEVAYDRVVLGYLSQIAEEISGRKGQGEDQLGQRISRLIHAMDPEALRRLLEAGATPGERKKFALNASQVLAADAVMEVVQAAARASKQTISHNLLRLLHKLAQHAETGPQATRAEADGALRNNVARLIDDWKLEDPNPKPYTAVLEGMVRNAPLDHSPDTRNGCEAAILVKMALELDCVGTAVYTAVDEMMTRHQLPELAALLQAAPRTTSAEEIWRRVATPTRLEAELANSPIDHEIVTILVERIGADAADSLLDRLATASDRSTRAAVMKQLLALGPGIGRLAVARLPDAPWFLQRNILVLLGKLGSWPEGFSPLTYMQHTDARIRREGIKLMLDSREHQALAVFAGLGDSDPSIVGLALSAALEACPAEALPLIERIAADSRRSSELRVAAVRILARTRAPQALRVLVGLALHRRFWLGRRLAPKSPELIAAVAALASHWSNEPMAAAVLDRALHHSDPDVRAAATSTA